MSKDYYISQIEKKLDHKVKIIDYIILLRDENFITTLFFYNDTKQIAIALDEKENIIFIDISFMGKFKPLDYIPECNISRTDNYKKLQIDKCPQLNGSYKVAGKLKSGKYSKEEFIDIILKKYSDGLC